MDVGKKKRFFYGNIRWVSNLILNDEWNYELFSEMRYNFDNTIVLRFQHQSGRLIEHDDVYFDSLYVALRNGEKGL